MSTDSKSEQNAPTVTAAVILPSAPAAQAAPVNNASVKVETPVAEVPKPVPAPAPVAKVEVAKEKCEYNSADFGGAVIVKLALKNDGVVIYDPVYKLKINSTVPKLMPLTPFFAERLNHTVVLCP